MMERTENRRWPDELGLGPAQQIEPRRVGQNSSAQVGQNLWTQPVGRTAGRHACKVNRDSRWSELVHLRFDCWIARWYEKPDPRPPPCHSVTLSPLKNSLM